MGKIWQAGDTVSFVELNELQAKADAYDKLMAEKKKKQRIQRKNQKLRNSKGGD